MKKLKKINVDVLIKTIRLENILDSFRDNLIYPKRRSWFKTLICKQKERLVDNSEVINSMVVFVNDYVRESVERAVTILLEDVLQKLSLKSNTDKLYIKKQLSARDVKEFKRIFKEEMKIMNVQNHSRLWSTLGISYGQGAERGIADLGKTPETIPWHQFRETKLYQQRLWTTLSKLSQGLSNRVLGVVAVGVADGLSPYSIAKRLRDIKLAPRKVFVNPKIVDGKVVRKEYSYIINQRLYSEMIARTESARALTEGRVDIYRRAGIKQVQWLTAGDERVCDNCQDLDGRIFPIDEAPMVPLHVDCRCDKVSAGLEKEVKIPSLTAGETLFANSLVNNYQNNEELLQNDLDIFKTNYTALSTIERKQFLRTTLSQYNSIGVIPKVSHSNLDDIGMMMLQAKKLEMLSARQKSILKLAQSNKKSLLFIGSRKMKILSNYLQPKFSDKWKDVFIKATQRPGLGGLSWSAIQKPEVFYKGKTTNFIYIPNYRNLSMLFSRYNATANYIIAGHTLIHELAHSLYHVKKVANIRIGSNFWSNVWDSYKMPTGYGNQSLSEGFAECLASRYMRTHELDNEILNFLDELENKLISK